MKYVHKNKVIVFGSNHHNTLGVVRALGEKGINPYVLVSSNNITKSFVLKSKYIAQGLILHSDNACLQYILENFIDKEHKAIIICATDSAASCIDLNYDRLIIDFFIPNCGKQGSLTCLMNKHIMNNVAKEAELTIAHSWIIDENKLVDGIDYPCITKPLTSIQGSKSDIKICQNENELKLFLHSRKKKTKIQVQHYIDKLLEFQLIGCSINGGRNVIIPGYTSIIRASSVTNTGYLNYEPISSLLFDMDKCVKFIQLCNYSGLFSLEFIRGKDGVDYFLEINMRNDGNAYAVTAAGVNLPFIWVASCIGEDIVLEAGNKVNSIIVMPELVDVYQMLSGRITLRKWLSDIKRTNCFLYYNKHDKRPFYAEIIRFLISITKDVFGKIKRKVIK